MANNLLNIAGLSGANYYLVLLTQANLFINGVTPEAYNGAHWTNYANAFSAVGPGTIFNLTFPSLAAGEYDGIVYVRAGGSAATSDPIAIVVQINWDGANLVASSGGSVDVNALAAALAALNVPINVTAISPVTQAGSINLVRGNDYFNADGREIPFTASAGAWPNLAGSTVNLQANIVPNNGSVGTPSFTVAGVVSASGSGTQSIYFEIPASITGGLAIGNGSYFFAANATLADGHFITLVQGAVNVGHEP